MFRNMTVEDKIAKLKENQVLVHVWTSEHNIRKRGMHNGSVSLELSGPNKTYISFDHKSSNSSFEQDINVVGRKPEYTFRFYTLNQKAIFDKVKELEQDLSVSKESENSANFIWLLLTAGGIENNISNTAKVVGKAQEAIKGKVHKLEGEAVIAEKAVGSISKASLFSSTSKNKIINGEVSVLANALLKATPKETQEHPIEEVIHGANYSFRSIFDQYKTADNIVKPLQIAQQKESDDDKLIKELDEREQVQDKKDQQSFEVGLPLRS